MTGPIGQPLGQVAGSNAELRTLTPRVAWATAGTVFNQGSTLLSNLLLANMLGRSVFGEFAMVLSTIQAITSLAALGIGYGATRYIAEWRHRDPERAGALLSMFGRLAWATAICAAGLLALAASIVAEHALRAPQLRTGLMIGAAAALFSIRNGYLLGALAGFEAFAKIGQTGIASGGLYLALTAGGGYLGGIDGAIVGILAAGFVQHILLTWALSSCVRREKIPRGTTTFRAERGLLVRFLLPGALSGLSTVPVLWGLQAILTRTPESFSDVAIYAIGLNFLSAVLFLPTVVNSVAMPMINRMRVAGATQYHVAYWANLRLTLVVVSTAIVLLLLSKGVLLGLYGAEFGAEGLVIGILLLAALPESATLALNQSLQARERMWHAFIGINLPRDATMIVMAVALVPRFGAEGAAISYLAGRVVALATMVFLVRNEFQAPVRPIPTPEER